MATRNFVPRKDGEGSIGKSRKHWGVAYIEKIFVKDVEVIGSGTENDAQPATVGWVKQRFLSLLNSGFTAAGLTCNITTNGYIKLGRLFGGLIIQWGISTVNINDFKTSNWLKTGVKSITFPITFPNKALVVVNNATSVHTNQNWIVGNASAQNITKEKFVSQMNTPDSITFIDNGNNEWGISGVYLAIGY